MRAEAFAALESIRAEFRGLVRRWSREHPYLGGLQERLRLELGYGDYRVETPIVYNRALDDIAPEDEIRFVLVADNPGKNEQLERNNRYLVGQSGKLASGWLARELGVDFRREVMILNKTPVHTPKTAELRRLLALAGPDRPRLAALLGESQVAMADLAFRAASALGAGRRPGAILWISGLGELRPGGLFEAYRDALADLISPARSKAPIPGRGCASVRAPRRASVSVWAFNHFSMNQFAVEFKRKADPARPALAELGRIGTENRKRVFGP